MTTLAPDPTLKTATTAAPKRMWGVMAEFSTPAAIYGAASKVRDAGYRYWDCHTPFPVHNLDREMGVKRTALPVVVFFAGMTGTFLGLALQAFANGLDWDAWLLVWVQGYPILISGKPLLSYPSMIPVIFELTVLLASLTAAGGMLAFNKLPQLSHPLLANKRFLRCSDDRFFITIEARDPKFMRSKCEAFLKSLGATAVEVVEEV